MGGGGGGGRGLAGRGGWVWGEKHKEIKGGVKEKGRENRERATVEGVSRRRGEGKIEGREKGKGRERKERRGWA